MLWTRSPGANPSTSTPVPETHAQDKETSTEPNPEEKEATITCFSGAIAIDLTKVVDSKKLDVMIGHSNHTRKDIAKGNVDDILGIGPKSGNNWRSLGVTTVKDLSEYKCVRYALSMRLLPGSPSYY